MIRKVRKTRMRKGGKNAVIGRKIKLRRTSRKVRRRVRRSQKWCRVNN